MRVLVDGLAARTGGGVTYLRSLIGAALAADGNLEVSLLCGAREPFAELERGGRTRLLDVLGPAPSAARRALWQQTGLPRLAEKIGADVIFAPAEIGPQRSSTPVLLGFQNPNLYERPVPVGVGQELRLRALLAGARSSARHARGLVFVSEPFRRVAGAALRANRSRQWTIEPGLDPVFRRTDASDETMEAPHPYVLCVADIYPHKNLLRLVDAFAVLARASGDELRLKLVGRPFDTRETGRLRERARAHGLEQRVILSGAVSLDRMPALYRGAACFVFPSLLESFGFPPLEAMASGVPVACARASVMPEICGDGAEYFDPHDASDIARAVSSILADEQRSAALVARGRAQAGRYSWERAGGALVEALRACAG
jgi:glycosyltransferase involved in cell wall biosynthesis